MANVGEIKAGLYRIAQSNISESVAAHLRAAIEEMQQARTQTLGLTEGSGQSDCDDAAGHMQSAIDDMEQTLRGIYGTGQAVEDIAARL